MKSNPKRFWGYVKSLKAAGQVPKEMNYNSAVLTSVFDIVNTFNHYFKSVFKTKSFMSAVSTLNKFVFNHVPIFNLPLV